MLRPETLELLEWNTKHFLVKKNKWGTKEAHAFLLTKIFGLRRYYAEWSKSDGGRQIPYDLTHMWNIKNKQTKINEQSKQKQTRRYIDTENREVVTRGEEVGGKVKWAEW